MLAKKLFALCREFPVAGAVPATTTRFARGPGGLILSLGEETSFAPQNPRQPLRGKTKRDDSIS